MSNTLYTVYAIDPSEADEAVVTACTVCPSGELVLEYLARGLPVPEPLRAALEREGAFPISEGNDEPESEG